MLAEHLKDTLSASAELQVDFVFSSLIKSPKSEKVNFLVLIRVHFSIQLT